MTEEKAKEPYQQALAIKINDKNDFATFELGSNVVTVELLKKAVLSFNNECYFVCGPHGSGKTHLLEALYQLDSSIKENSFFLDMNTAKNLGPFVLDINLPKLTILDNVDVIAGDDEFELALFALFNRWYDKREGTLIVTSSESFDKIPFNKVDLNTRMSSGIALSLDYLSEKDCVSALKKRAEQRGLNFPDKTISFLVRHCNHDMRSLVALLDRLEKAQLEQNRELTIPFVKMVLSIE